MDVAADLGDNLLVTGTVINLRSGPSLNDPVLLKLNRGTRVIEISRHEEWIEVTIDRDDIEVGWIHASLLEPEVPGPEDGEIASSHFQRFMLDFEHYRNDRLLEDGITHFSDISSDLKGLLKLTITDDWFSLPLERREEILSEIFRIWKGSAESGSRVSVEVVDKNQEAHMMIFR
jgi:hypothetical protein